MNFVIGAVTAVVAIGAYWMVIALYEWIDLRPARRIQRATVKPPPR